jgi:hypothetical protein
MRDVERESARDGCPGLGMRHGHGGERMHGGGSGTSGHTGAQLMQRVGGVHGGRGGTREEGGVAHAHVQSQRVMWQQQEMQG